MAIELEKTKKEIIHQYNLDYSSFGLSLKLYEKTKRVFDIVLSAMALIVLSPLLLIVAVLIKMDSKGKAIYSQERVGKNGRKFKIYKFRSMVENADCRIEQLKAVNEKDGPIFKIKKDPRITRIGKIIRKTSIDELPQLVNVIKGDMSLVGPRPPLVKEVEQYTEYQKKRLSVIPGLTCYWQISGRSNLSFEQWVELDLKYIRERSLLCDIMIILKTIPVVIIGRGAY